MSAPDEWELEKRRITRERAGWMDENAPKALDLALSAQAEALEQQVRYDTPAEEGAEAARAYIERARELGAPPELWCVNQRDGYPNQNHNGSESCYAGAVGFLLGCNDPCVGAVAAAAALMDAGASPWADALHGGLKGRFGARIKPVSAKELAMFTLGSMRLADPGARAALLKGALARPLAHAAEAVVPRVGAFMESLIAVYKESVEESSATAAGELGPSDTKAKWVAEVILAGKSELLAVSANEALEHGPAIRAMIKDAQERFELKSRPAHPSADPERVRAEASERFRNRAKGLGAVVTACRDDPAFIKSVFDASGWMDEAPNLASVVFQGSPSVFQQALMSGSQSAVEELTKRGANIWLASAQAGVANACLWSITIEGRQSYRYLEDRAALARALLDGAWLDGAADPKAHCLKKGQEMMAALEGENGVMWGRGRALMVALESAVIEEETRPGKAMGRRASL